MKKHFIAIIVLVVIFVGFFLYAAWPTMQGTGVELKLLPVDPFDLIRGQYLILNYEINQAPEELPAGSQVFVVLEKGEDGIHHPVRYSNEWPVTRAGQVVIRGLSSGRRVDYGIESLFMERGARLSQRMTDLTAYVRILPDGRASVVELHKDGEPAEFEYREGNFLER